MPESENRGIIAMRGGAENDNPGSGSGAGHAFPRGCFSSPLISTSVSGRRQEFTVHIVQLACELWIPGAQHISCFAGRPGTTPVKDSDVFRSGIQQQL